METGVESSADTSAIEGDISDEANESTATRRITRARLVMLYFLVNYIRQLSVVVEWRVLIPLLLLLVQDPSMLSPLLLPLKQRVIHDPFHLSLIQ